MNASVLEPVVSKGAMPSHEVVTHAHQLAQKPTITHDEEKVALILFLAGGFVIWYMFNESLIPYRHWAKGCG